MQYLVRLMTVGLAEIVLVKLLYCRILVRLAQSHICILLVNRLSAYSPDVLIIALVSGLYRLSASVYASAGTRHNLYEIIGRYARSYVVHNLPCICKSGRYANLYLLAVEVIFRFFNTLSDRSQ